MPTHVGAQNKSAVRLAAKVDTIETKVQRILPWDAERIRDLRARLGLSQCEFAPLVGVSKLSIHRWETGKTTPQNRAITDRLDELEKGTMHGRT